jgi:hypothetical protein
MADQLIYRLNEPNERNVSRFIRELSIEQLDSQLALEEILDRIKNLRTFRSVSLYFVAESMVFLATKLKMPSLWQENQCNGTLCR